MSTITVSSSMLIPSAKSMRLKPSQVAIVWEIAHELDRKRIEPSTNDAVWLKIPTKRLRNPDGKNDNWRLKQWLDELVSLKLEGSHKGDVWGAALIAEYRIKEGGSLAEILIPPAGIKAVLAPQTFAKIEIEAKYRLKGTAKLLYAALADKKRQTTKPWHVYDLDELHHVVQCVDRYPRWADFNRYVLQPAIKEINDYGTVKVKATPEKLARSIVAVRFDWDWKSLDEAQETDKANGNHSVGRGKTSDGSASPLTDIIDSPEDTKSLEDKAEYRAWLALHPKGTFQQFYDQKHKQAG